MGELTLVGLHEDGEHVVVQAGDGQRFRLRIDEALRAAVRRDRPRLEQARQDQAATLSPREIQTRIRAGALAEEVAEEAGVPVALVERYEGPVQAERAFVAGQARATRVGHEAGAPALGDLVTDRLATRGVAPEEIEWDARRAAGGAPWTVLARFTVGDEPRLAQWTFDVQGRSLRAEDDEARWLSETELLDTPIPRRHLSPVREKALDLDAAIRPVLAAVDLPVRAEDPEPAAEEDPAEMTEALLEDLAGRRGTRQELELPDEEADGATDDEDFEGFGPQHAFDFENPDLTLPPGAHPPESRPDLATDARILSLRPRSGADTEPPVAGSGAPEDTEPPATGPGRSADATVPDPAEEPTATTATPSEAPSARARARKGRASVPSWDEIVFGARPD